MEIQTSLSIWSLTDDKIRVKNKPTGFTFSFCNTCNTFVINSKMFLLSHSGVVSVAWWANIWFCVQLQHNKVKSEIFLPVLLPVGTVPSLRMFLVDKLVWASSPPWQEPAAWQPLPSSSSMRWHNRLKRLHKTLCKHLINFLSIQIPVAVV